MAIGWAIVSTGRHPDQKMVPAINAAADSEIAAVVSRDLERARAFADKHGARRAYDDFDRMLGDPDVQVVYIASPNALHADQATRAAAAGKHVFVEKPMALTVADCERMIAAARDAKTQLGVGFHLRTHPGHQRLREIVRGGGLGRIALATAAWNRGTRGQAAPPPRPPRQQWWEDPALAGAGVFMATGVHCCDLLAYVLGKEITHVAAMTDANDASPLEELVAMLLRFEDGSVATLTTSRRVPDWTDNGISVHGSDGRGSVRRGIDVNLTGELEIATNADSSRERYDDDPIALYRREVEAFNDAVRGLGEPAATGADGLRAARVTVAMVESHRGGRTVRI